MNKYGSHRRPLSALRIRDVRHLCLHLATHPAELDRICRVAPRYYFRHSAADAKGKVRDYATPQGRLRQILDRLNNLLQRIELPDSVHGGRRGRSYETNAAVHLNQPALLKTDVSKFFPSIPYKRVYRMFRDDMECIPDVAHYLTRLVTLDGAVPQGSPTSTIVAALVTRRMSERIEGLAKDFNARTSQYVDDISISGSPAVAKLKPRLTQILEQEGFTAHPDKTDFISGRKERVVTGVRVNSDKDVPRAQLDKIRNAIKAVEAVVHEGSSIEEKTLRRIDGQLRHVARFNRGAAKHYRRRLARVMSRQICP